MTGRESLQGGVCPERGPGRPAAAALPEHSLLIIRWAHLLPGREGGRPASRFLQAINPRRLPPTPWQDGPLPDLAFPPGAGLGHMEAGGGDNTIWTAPFFCGSSPNTAEGAQVCHIENSHPA